MMSAQFPNRKVTCYLAPPLRSLIASRHWVRVLLLGILLQAAWVIRGDGSSEAYGQIRIEPLAVEDIEFEPLRDSEPLRGDVAAPQEASPSDLPLSAAPPASLIELSGPGDLSGPQVAAESRLIEQPMPVSEHADSMDRELDEIWLVSSRGIACPGCDVGGLTYQRRLDDCWVSMRRDDFDHSLESPKPTVIFVHGNRTDLSYAVRRGMQAYRSFVASSPAPEGVRFVIWAWPSEQVSVGIRDFRLKADRADLEGCLFGTFLSRLPADQQLNLIGYSYGSRIVLGGVSMLSGESLWGRHVSLPSGYAPPPMRVTLIAAAAPPSSLLPGQRYAPAYPLIERLVLINNREDRALKLYRFVDRATSNVAMGSLGLAAHRLDDAGQRLAQWDVSRHVGPQHKIDLYFASSVVGRLVREQVGWVTDDEANRSTVDSGSASGRR
ncbi:MAG: alpha/beta hydrolase [Planctomycetales bacterium]|nr:alpha/beta hydrolase [Planctomycetales bacterium]